MTRLLPSPLRDRMVNVEFRMVNVRKSSERHRLRQFNIHHLSFNIFNAASHGTRTTLNGVHRENFHPQEVGLLAELPQ